MSEYVTENWFDIEILGKYSFSSQIDMLIESTYLDLEMYESGIISEGAIEAIKEKIIALIDKFISWITAVLQKIKEFFTKRNTVETVEANFKAAKKRKTAQGESYNMLSEAYSIEESNEKIHAILLENDPVYCFKNNDGPLCTMAELLNDLEGYIKSGSKIRDRNGKMGCIIKLSEEYSSPDDYFSREFRKYSDIISENADCVENGLEYFFDDFKHIDEYILTYERDFEKSLKILDQLKKRMHLQWYDDEEIRVCMKGISAINKARPWYTAWLYQLKKTKSIITRISEVARGPQQLAS